MTITIPTWLLWALGLGIGVPLMLAVLFLAWLGWVAARWAGSPFR